VTLTAGNASQVGARIGLLIHQADAKHCDLVAKQGEYRGYLYVGDGRFKTNTASASPVSDAVLRAMARLPGNEITYTCVPPGSGMRIALDRDEDGALDGDENIAGTSPADARSKPPALAALQKEMPTAR
jgi:hypothetical protein